MPAPASRPGGCSAPPPSDRDQLRNLRRLRRPRRCEPRRRRTSTARGRRLLQVPLRGHRPGRQPGRRHQRQRGQGRLRRRRSTRPPGCSATGGSARPHSPSISSDAFTGTSGSSLAAHSGRARRPSGSTRPVPRTRSSATPDRVRRNGAGYSIDYVDDDATERGLLRRGRPRRTCPTSAATRPGSSDASTPPPTRSTWRGGSSPPGRRPAPGAGEVQQRHGDVLGSAHRTGRARRSGETYRIKLEMSGSSLALYVNGVLKVSVTDTTLTAAGKAGIMDGADAAQRQQEQHHRAPPRRLPGHALDLPRAADSKGSNTGDYMNGVTLGVAGCPGGRHRHRRVVRRRQRLRPGAQHHGHPGRRELALGRGVVQDVQRGPPGDLRLRQPGAATRSSASGSTPAAPR